MLKKIRPFHEGEGFPHFKYFFSTHLLTLSLNVALLSKGRV